MRRVLVVIAVLIAAWRPVAALAHITVRAQERSPSGVTTLALSAPLETSLLGADGGTATPDRADPYLLRLRPARPGGAMRVRVLSRDGHVSHIRIQGATVTTQSRDGVWAILGRWLMIGALVVIVGVVGVGRLVIAPGVRHPLRNLTAPAVDPPSTGVIARLGERTAIVGGLGALAAFGALLTVIGTLQRLGSRDVATLVGETRLGAVLALVGAAGLVCAAIGVRRREIESPALLGAGVGAAAALVAISLGGHATSGTDALLSGVFDAAHMIATAIWVGGLVALLLSALPPGTDPAIGTLAAVVVRFSGVALVCVAVLAVTGAYRALAELAHIADLVRTGYGRTLLVKLILFSVMLAIGAYNRFVLHPRLERAAIGLSADARGAGAALRRSVRAEVTLATLVLGVVAVMIGFPPP